ncbi:Uncharacterised protein [uncultured archaeon]|nr:Uncharacterised protein [uncultured archaeon]
MACFIAPAATAVSTTLLGKKTPEKYHIKWLNTMLWGGTAGLMIEHIAHGEIILSPPFLTATTDSSAMLHEILTVGAGMTIACIATWAILVAAVSMIEAKNKTTQTA